MKPLYIVIICIVIAGGAFFGGMQFQKTRRLQPGQFFINTQGGAGAFRLGTGRNAAGGRLTGAFTAGQILSGDEKGLTLKLQNGGSKLVFFSASTTVQKMTDASLQDLKAGANVVVTGEDNPDGSITARGIQLRTEMPVLQPGLDGGAPLKPTQ